MLGRAAQHAPRNGDVGRVEFGNRTSKELRVRMTPASSEHPARTPAS